MTGQVKLVAAVALAPIVADFLEDCEFTGTAKIKVNNLINQIRRFDEWMIGQAEREAQEQQVDIQRAFREWVKFNFE